ncbi:MAG: zinc ribbon domain-containing protein [Opitutales bacterium]|nr:zinc ribbon domain-containing protein [Opitutales bacterium]
MFCSNCGKKVPEGANFCASCGSKIVRPNPAVSGNLASQKQKNPLPTKPSGVPSKKNKKNRFRSCLLIFGGVIVFFGVLGNLIESNTTKTEQKKTPEQSKEIEQGKEPEKPYEAPILKGAIWLYPETEEELKAKGYSKTLQKFGLEGIKKINKLIPIAAQKAAKSKKCDAVAVASLSSNRSSKDNLVFYVDAKNSTRFYFSEVELMDDSPVMSIQEKLAPLLSRHELLAEEVIKSQLKHPSTYDRHEMGVFKSRTTYSCNEITIEFSAKNAFNLELTYIATVQFDEDSKVVGFHMQEKQ